MKEPRRKRGGEVQIFENQLLLGARVGGWLTYLIQFGWVRKYESEMAARTRW